MLNIWKVRPILIIVKRIQIFLKINLNYLVQSFNWLIKSREFTNYTYKLTEVNLNQIKGMLSFITNIPINQINNILKEIENPSFVNKINDIIKNSKRNREVDLPLNFGRRIVWYVLIRIYKPKLVVESGTEKGIGSLLILEALEKNSYGSLVTIDIDLNSASYLTNLNLGNLKNIKEDSLKVLKNFEEIDFFIHDSNHSIEHEKQEYELIQNRISENAIVISDNSHCSNALYEWSEKNDRVFIFINEAPEDHFYSGGGVGISMKKRGGGGI